MIDYKSDEALAGLFTLRNIGWIISIGVADLIALVPMLASIATKRYQMFHSEVVSDIPGISNYSIITCGPSNCYLIIR